uniref:DNA-directed RNA polymerase subunit n=1 Tax=Astrephomene gubernaculifera TaxID=47775 RepID=A0A7R6ULJ4_9CHLO|nr:chloroplast RNA polymerase beta' chain [Astrephomene gubernaculifera]
MFILNKQQILNSSFFMAGLTPTKKLTSKFPMVSVITNSDNLPSGLYKMGAQKVINTTLANKGPLVLITQRVIRRSKITTLQNTKRGSKVSQTNTITDSVHKTNLSVILGSLRSMYNFNFCCRSNSTIGNNINAKKALTNNNLNINKIITSKNLSTFVSVEKSSKQFISKINNNNKSDNKMCKLKNNKNKISNYTLDKTFKKATQTLAYYNLKNNIRLNKNAKFKQNKGSPLSTLSIGNTPIKYYKNIYNVSSIYNNNKRKPIDFNTSKYNKKASTLLSKITQQNNIQFTKNYQTFGTYSKMTEINLITISLASANRIRQWAEKTLPNGKVVGEVINPETVHYKTLKPIKGGLFCERIFGPLKDHECACGKKFNIKNYLAKVIKKSQNNFNTGSNQSAGVEVLNPKDSVVNTKFLTYLKNISLQKRYFCRVCDVEYTYSIIRRTQLGYIQLASPTTHVWYVKGIPSYISILLDMKKKHLQNITYNIQTLTLEHSFRGRQNWPSTPSSIFETWQKIMKMQYPERYSEKKESNTKKGNFLLGGNAVQKKQKSTKYLTSIIAQNKKTKIKIKDNYNTNNNNSNISKKNKLKPKDFSNLLTKITKDKRDQSPFTIKQNKIFGKSLAFFNCLITKKNCFIYNQKTNQKLAFLSKYNRLPKAAFEFQRSYNFYPFFYQIQQITKTSKHFFNINLTRSQQPQNDLNSSNKIYFFVSYNSKNKQKNQKFFYKQNKKQYNLSKKFSLQFIKAFVLKKNNQHITRMLKTKRQVSTELGINLAIHKLEKTKISTIPLYYNSEQCYDIKKQTKKKIKTTLSIITNGGKTVVSPLWLLHKGDCIDLAGHHKQGDLLPDTFSKTTALTSSVPWFKLATRFFTFGDKLSKNNAITDSVHRILFLKKKYNKDSKQFGQSHSFCYKNKVNNIFLSKQSDLLLLQDALGLPTIINYSTIVESKWFKQLASYSNILASINFCYNNLFLSSNNIIPFYKQEFLKKLKIKTKKLPIPLYLLFHSKDHFFLKKARNQIKVKKILNRAITYRLSSSYIFCPHFVLFTLWVNSQRRTPFRWMWRGVISKAMTNTKTSLSKESKVKNIQIKKFYSQLALNINYHFKKTKTAYLLFNQPLLFSKYLLINSFFKVWNIFRKINQKTTCFLIQKKIDNYKNNKKNKQGPLSHYFSITYLQRIQTIKKEATHKELKLNVGTNKNLGSLLSQNNVITDTVPQTKPFFASLIFLAHKILKKQSKTDNFVNKNNILFNLTNNLKQYNLKFFEKHTTKLALMLLLNLTNSTLSSNFNQTLLKKQKLYKKLFAILKNKLKIKIAQRLYACYLFNQGLFYFDQFKFICNNKSYQLNKLQQIQLTIANYCSVKTNDLGNLGEKANKSLQKKIKQHKQVQMYLSYLKKAKNLTQYFFFLKQNKKNITYKLYNSLIADFETFLKSNGGASTLFCPHKIKLWTDNTLSKNKIQNKYIKYLFLLKTNFNFNKIAKKQNHFKYNQGNVVEVISYLSIIDLSFIKCLFNKINNTFYKIKTKNIICLFNQKIKTENIINITCLIFKKKLTKFLFNFNNIFNNTKNFVINNIYTVSHRELWEQEKDWQNFAIYYYSQTNITDTAIPLYKHHNYDLLFNIDNDFSYGLEANDADFYATQTQKYSLGVNINTALSGAGLIQKLLNEFNYSELKKMDKQNRILLFEYNKHIKKLKEIKQNKKISKSVTILSSVLNQPENSLFKQINQISSKKSKNSKINKIKKGLLIPKKIFADTNPKSIDLEYYKACHIRDVLMRRTKLTRKIFNKILPNNIYSTKNIKEEANGQNNNNIEAKAQSNNIWSQKSYLSLHKNIWAQEKETNGLNMILTLLPVLPPVLRPVLKLAGQWTISDLNRLYQRIIYRNDRLKKFLKDPALSSSFEMKYAQRLLQESVDNLIQNGKSGVVPEKDARGRLLKSLSEILKGKQGRFRQYLLGKRVDYSGRSVIVVGPRLKLHECGIPKEMALVLYSPFLIKRILNEKLADTYLSAKKLIQTNPLLVSQLLREIMQSVPVLLNRAPTLHRLGFQAFKPKLVDGKAILLHPLVCPSFNADFDGDQMAVHVPITFEARAEAWKLMLARNNLLSPATGEPIILPSQDMVLGCYYLTTNCGEKSSKIKKGAGMLFHSINDVLKAYNQQLIHMHAPVWVNIKGYIENGTISEQALEIRIPLSQYYKNFEQNQKDFNSSYTKRGNLNYMEVYTKSHRILNFKGILINQTIRTTPGKILFNIMIKNVIEKRPALFSKYKYGTGLIKNKLINTFDLQTNNFYLSSAKEMETQT